MGKLVRMISHDGAVMACAIDSTDIVARIERTHKTSAVVSAAVGRLTTAASIMGYSLKGKDDTLTLRINGGGETGSIIAVANSMGNVKAYVQNPIVELPLNNYGKLDVKGAVGTVGFLSVVKDLGLKEPYVGQVPIFSGEIAEDITSYFALSEQTPTVCGLGVLVNPDLTIKAAGGYLIQLLPFADEACIQAIEKNINNIDSVSTMIDNGVTPKEICERLLNGLEPDLLETAEVFYKCDCNQIRIEKALISVGEKELQAMIDEEDGCEVSCHFCNKKYKFSSEALSKLITDGKNV